MRRSPRLSLAVALVAGFLPAAAAQDIDPPRMTEKMELKGAPLSPSAIQWTWNDLTFERHYFLVDLDGNLLDRIPSTESSPVIHTETGLRPGTPYQRYVVGMGGWFPRPRPNRP